MTCETATLLLHFNRPHDMDAEDRTALDAHLAGCPGCTALMARTRAEDAAIGKAMTAITIPVGFRDALQNQAIQVQNGLWWSKWTGRTAALAASILFTVLSASTYAHATRQTLDSEQLLADFDHRGASNSILFDDWRSTHGLPKMPEDFDLRLVNYTGEQTLHGKSVPTVRLQAGSQSATVYYLRGSQFNLANAVDAIGSNGIVKVYRDQPGGYTILIISTGTSLAPFLHNPADAA